VRHKERLKQMRKEIDVLAMSATPIPRTLHMSLVGLRDMSVIETPPRTAWRFRRWWRSSTRRLCARRSKWSWSAAGRFICPQPGGIDLRNCRADSGTGARGAGCGRTRQMGEAELERVMLAFMRHEYDVLVATTIIENGLDIPLANTMLINRADRHG